MEGFVYKKASLDELEWIWDKNIAANIGDNRWVAWKPDVIERNKNGTQCTFVALCADEPIGEVSLLLSPECIQGRTDLADGETVANVNALRVERKHRGNGHSSKLMQLAESHANNAGIKILTIGVEPAETRNLAIYLHWGYTKFVRHDIEDDDGELVLYYAKELA